MPGLTIQCRFIAHSYSGVRKDRDQRDQLDWPPAPARLHQALIAATLTNLPESLRDAYSDKALAALRWLERLPPPDINASKLAADEDYRRALSVAMPHNSPAKGDFSRYHSDLAPVLRATPEQENGSLFVAYRWMDDTAQFRREAEVYLAALKEAAAKLGYLGRAEDRVECEVVWREDDKDTVNETQEIWRPVFHAADLSLQTVRPNSTTELIQEFVRANQRIERGSKRPARLFLRDRSYSRDAAEGLLPIHGAIFQIFRNTHNPDEPPAVCDAVNAHRWRAPLRALACRIAKEAQRWSDPTLAEELISGHAQGGRANATAASCVRPIWHRSACKVRRMGVCAASHFWVMQILRIKLAQLRFIERLPGVSMERRSSPVIVCNSLTARPNATRFGGSIQAQAEYGYPRLRLS